MTVPLSYIVVEDGIMMQPGVRTGDALEPGEVLEVTVSGTEGSTYQLISNQEPAAPAATRPSAIVGGCGEEIMGDFGNLFEVGNGNPGETTVCRTNVGSYDPNEKIGYPLGYNDSHDIEPGTRLTYDLHFQNTGTDTAFTVVIRDTIPAELDLCSLELGAGSHDVPGAAGQQPGADVHSSTTSCCPTAPPTSPAARASYSSASITPRNWSGATASATGRASTSTSTRRSLRSG